MSTLHSAAYGESPAGLWGRHDGYTPGSGVGRSARAGGRSNNIMAQTLRILALVGVFWWCLGCAEQSGVDPSTAYAAIAPLPTTRTLTVDGATRTALVYPGRNALTTPSPLVLVFHGFTGTAEGMAGTSRLQVLWPEATVVYPQGLNVLKPSTGLWAPGWPDAPDKYGDRDLHYVTALLASLAATYRVDARRVYATGFSNGATFSYLLYTQMPGSFTAFAGEAGPATFLDQATTPRPLLTINGEQDEFVYPALTATMLAEFQRANHCGPSTTSWDFNPAFSVYTPTDAGGQPLVWFRHPGGHEWISGSGEAMVAFFQEH